MSLKSGDRVAYVGLREKYKPQVAGFGTVRRVTDTIFVKFDNGEGGGFSHQSSFAKLTEKCEQYKGLGDPMCGRGSACAYCWNLTHEVNGNILG